MLKLVGSVLLFAGCAGCGFCFCHEMGERERILKQLLRLFSILESEIGYNRATIPEGLGRAGKKAGGELGKYMIRISERMKSGQGLPLEQVWQEEMAEWVARTCLNERERTILLEFPSCLGFSDGQMQLREIGRFCEELKTAKEKTAEEIRSRKKVILALSQAVGALLVISLL